jgi:DNA-binding CsgD family transcriptional regulator
MSHSQVLRESDVRVMLRLMGEIGELPREGDHRRQHMLGELARLTGARSGTAIRARHSFPALAGGRPKRKIHVMAAVSVGLDESWQMAPILRYLTTMMPTDPLSEPLYSRPGSAVTCGREQLMPRRLWHRTDHFNAVRRAAGVDDCIATKLSADDDPLLVETVCVHRAVHEGPFAPRQWKMLQLFLAEVRPLLFQQPPTTAQTDDLSPRLRQTLQCLLAGDSVKQAARKLDLSVHTVNEYVKALHRHYAVASRGELLARFLRRDGARPNLPSQIPHLPTRS